MNLKQEIISIRKEIRRHRDQRGDDRCWVDDYWIYELAPGNKRILPKKISFEEGMARCKTFYEKRREMGIFDNRPEEVKKFNDNDLELMNISQLKTELHRLRKAIVKYRNISDSEKTIEDDKELYFVLPEKIRANFKLPSKEEFIDGIKKGCGCPNFWKSHEDCKIEHDYHKWGPCK